LTYSDLRLSERIFGKTVENSSELKDLACLERRTGLDGGLIVRKKKKLLLFNWLVLLCLEGKLLS
jgi:hypothetical protein